MEVVKQLIDIDQREPAPVGGAELRCGLVVFARGHIIVIAGDLLTLFPLKSNISRTPIG